MESKKINQLATELAPDLSDITIIGDPTTGISKKITLSQMASLFTGTVEEYANFAAFPLVGVADTIYIALDTNILYRWNTGTSAYVELSPNIVSSLVFNDANGFDGTINLVGSVATLTITTALTTGSVGFIGASGALLQDNANFFWDDTNNRLGLGTNAPTTALDVFGSGIIGRINGTSTNNAFLGFASAGTNKWSIGNVQSDHRFRIYNEATTSELVSVLSTGEFGIGIANPTTKFHIDGAASALIANLDANVSVAKSISFRSDNSNRINLEVSGTESGSDAGANFFIRRYSDAGALIDTPLTITRSTGAISLATTLNLSEIQALTSAGITLKSNGGTSVALFGAGGGAGTTLYGGLIGTSGSFSSTITAVGLSKFWDGTQGFNIGAATFGTGYGALYSTGVTPSSINFSFTSNGLSSYVNATNDAGITINNGSAGIFLISTGNVGIGTSSPVNKLQVNSTSGDGMFLTSYLTTSGAADTGAILGFGIYDGVNNRDAAIIKGLKENGTSGNYASYLSFFTRPNGAGLSERMRITSGGNIFIGYVNTGVTDTRMYISGQGTTSSTYSLVVKQSNNSTELFVVRDDGVIFTGQASRSPYNDVSAAAANLIVVSGGNLQRSTSSLRFKTNVEDLYTDTSSLLYKMRPIWYRSLGTSDRKDWSWYGFIAEELAEIEPRLVHWGYDISSYEEIEIIDEEGNLKQEKKLKEDAVLIPDGVQYERITVLLVSELQKIRKELDELKAKIK